MNKEKQIEEMAQIIGHCESTLHPVIKCHDKSTGCYCIENPCHNQRLAEKLYNAGYRKQSEGEWEIVKGSHGKEIMVCTNCRHSQDLYSTFTYCPNCGARMHGAKRKGGEE